MPGGTRSVQIPSSTAIGWKVRRRYGSSPQAHFTSTAWPTVNARANSGERRVSSCVGPAVRRSISTAVV